MAARTITKAGLILNSLPPGPAITGHQIRKSGIAKEAISEDGDAVVRGQGLSNLCQHLLDEVPIVDPLRQGEGTLHSGQWNRPTAIPERRHKQAHLVGVTTLIDDRIDRLRASQVPLHELVLTYHLSRDPAEYQTDTLNAIVARELAGRGVTLNPGESVRYVITEYQADVPSDRARAWEFIDGSWGYDVERYTELLMRAAESIFVPFGVNASMLRSWLVKELPAENLRARLEARPPRRYLGPLFELGGPTLPVKPSRASIPKEKVALA